MMMKNLRTTPAPLLRPRSTSFWAAAGFALVGAFWLACASPDSPQATDSSSEASRAAADSLDAVPEPPLTGLPEVAGEQIGAQRAALAKLGSSASGTELAAAYGRLGELYHAYALARPALVAYGNASALAPSDPRWVYLGGLAHQGEGRIEEAKEAFAKTLDLDPANQAARLHLASIHMTLGDLDQAEPLYEGVLQAEAGNTAAIFGRGRIAEARGELQAAAADYEAALVAQPAAKNLHSLLASLYRRLDDKEAAERHLAEFGGGTVVFDDPIFDQMKSLVGGIGPMLDGALEAYGDEDYELAAERYLEVLDVEPANSTALSGAATSLRKAGDLERAISVFRRFVEADPENRVAQLELATSLLEFGDLDEALPLFDELAERAPDFEEAHFNYGVALARAERWPEAIRSFRSALELEPRDQTARFHLALALEQTGSVEAALATFERVVQEAPSFVRARQRLGALLEAKGRPEQAQVHFRAVAELEEAPQEERALASYQLGRFAALDGRDEDAVRYFEQATRWLPELWQAHIALGRRYLASRRFDDATSAFARAVEINPGDVAARVEESQSLIAAGRFADARRRLEAGLEALPKSAEIAHALARLLATAPDSGLRDGNRAIQLATGVLEAYPWPIHAETYVMALAELGRFEEAAARQEQLIKGAEDEGREVDLPRLRAQLKSYLERRPIRLGPA